MKLPTKVFKPGDKVVYPVHGVGVIHSIVKHSIAGSDHHVYEISIVSSGMRVVVPVDQAESKGLRRVVDKKGVAKVYSILRDHKFKLDTQTWNRRFREYSQKINSGSVYEIAEVIRDLSVLKEGKELSFGERKMLDKAQQLLVAELAVAKARTEEKVMGEIQALFT